MRTLRIGTRPSPLAVKQVEEVGELLPSVHFEIIKIETEGERDKTTPISETEGTSFFTRDIEEALLAGHIDAAVHSAKDLEDEMPKELMIAAMTKPISPYDCLVSSGYKTLANLAKGARVGTSSRSRKEALLKYRPDLRACDVRGTIGERLARLDRGELDALIVAHAALIRLGYEDRIAEIVPAPIMKTHPLQGKLVIQIRRDRSDLFNLFRGIDEEYKG